MPPGIIRVSGAANDRRSLPSPSCAATSRCTGRGSLYVGTSAQLSRLGYIPSAPKAPGSRGACADATDDPTPTHDPTPTSSDDDRDDDSPSLRQRLHAATGDREREAEALADRSPDDVSVEDAKVAVTRAHGESVEDVERDSELASPADAERAADEDRSS